MCVLVRPPSPSFLPLSFPILLLPRLLRLPNPPSSSPFPYKDVLCSRGGKEGGVWQRKDIGRFSPSFLSFLHAFELSGRLFFSSEIYWVAGKLCVRGSTLLKWLVRRVCRHTYSIVRYDRKKILATPLIIQHYEKMQRKYVDCYYKMPSGYAGGPPWR